MANNEKQRVARPARVKVGNVTVGNDRPFVFIGGPDSLETLDRALFFADAIKTVCDRLDIPYIYKSSYDKAQRTSAGSFRGVGLEKALEMFRTIREKIGVPVTTDVHSPEEARRVGEVVDLLQIPAFLGRQTDILIAAGETGKPVNIKKPPFMAAHDIEGPVGKIRSTGNDQILLTERGYMFGYGRHVVDFRNFDIMKKTGFPVVFDASHALQLPSAGSGRSTGEREFIFPLVKAALATGIAAIFLEVYDDPMVAPVDGDSSFLLRDIPKAFKWFKEIDRLIKGY